MKNYYHFVAIIFLFLTGINFELKAQLPNPVSFNTGVNASLNGTIPTGTNDLSWTASTVSINGPFVPAVRTTGNAAWLISPYTTADWITYPHPFPNAGNQSYHNSLGNVDEYFRLMFTLPSGVCNGSVNSSGGYCLSMSYFADNCVNEIFVNGVSSYVNPAPSYTANNFQGTSGATVTLCDNWCPGTNTLIVHIKSGPPQLGFLAFTTASTTAQNQFTINMSKSNVTCYDANNGSAAVNLIGYGGTPTYTWLPGGSNNSSITNLSPGTYTVNVQFPLCNYSNTLTVTQPASFAVNVSTAQAVCPGMNVTYTATGGVTYSWTPGNYSGSTVTLSAMSTTNYTVTGKDSVGCAVTKAFKLQVLNCSGIEEVSLQGIDVRNDMLGNITIVAPNNIEYKVEIFDLIGNLKYSSLLAQNSEINLSNLSQGIYFLKVSDNNSSLKKRILVGM
ncbi:T9SS type A sorting domain-containing protein [Aurantibacillus circumpalustris]|uniref:T9SS type A sorting domain-containing protein n=1 Tax=Aurantibacillus circumpalustris TaxID=3036359 RepID=UPI00295A95D2|nr:T9SS type A sorting domain-containing protein [Aurantibacillus circumpalustris]